MSRAALALDLLEEIASAYAPAALSSSLGAEDMVLTDLIARAGLPIDIFTLDTGRLHAETHELLSRVQSHYGISLRVVRPDAMAVTDYVTRHGRDAFYGGKDLRLRCCEIRKVEPLRRALAGKRAWITGLRRAQSSARVDARIAGYDAAHGLAKFNPLADWSDDDVWTYLREHRVPYNPLHDRGYPSIGCEPCTRAVEPGEDPRAGRWWWEEQSKKECGLHVNGAIGDSPQLKQQETIPIAVAGLAFQIHPAGKAGTMEKQTRDVASPGGESA